MTAADRAPPRSFQDLLDQAGRRQGVRMVLAAADDSLSLRAAVEAAQLNIITPILVGAIDRVRRVAEEEGLEIRGYELIDVADESTAAMTAVRLVRDGAAELLMKGALASKTFIRAVLDHEGGLRARGILSHVAALEAADHDRLILMTDSAVNVNPHFARKVEIVANAVETARRLGLVQPKVAMLAAVEKVTLPAMRATLDADMMRRLGDAGHFGDCLVAGPIALDAALSVDRAAHKGMADPVAGRADILVVPNIESGNILYKTITCIARREMAGAIVGAKVPLVLMSRSDTAQTKLNCIAFAVLLTEERSA